MKLYSELSCLHQDVHVKRWHSMQCVVVVNPTNNKELKNRKNRTLYEFM